MSPAKPAEVETLPAEDAAARLPELLKGVEAGRVYVLTRDGHPIAKVAAADQVEDETELARRRQEAHARLIEHLRTSPGLRIEPWTREELYERGRTD